MASRQAGCHELFFCRVGFPRQRSLSVSFPRLDGREIPRPVRVFTHWEPFGKKRCPLGMAGRLNDDTNVRCRRIPGRSILFADGPLLPELRR